MDKFDDHRHSDIGDLTVLIRLNEFKEIYKLIEGIPLAKSSFCCILTTLLRSESLTTGYNMHLCSNFS